MIFASLKKRIAAFLLDYIIISAYIILLVVVGVGLGSGPLKSMFRLLFANPNISELSAFIILVFPVILYFTFFEHSSWQATWGKRKMGLIVTDAKGGRISFIRSFVRSCLKFIPWELTHACIWRIPNWPLSPLTPPPIIIAGLILVWVIVAAYLLSIFYTKKHQALYDGIAGTYVVIGGK